MEKEISAEEVIKMVEGNLERAKELLELLK